MHDNEINALRAGNTMKADAMVAANTCYVYAADFILSLSQEPKS